MKRTRRTVAWCVGFLLLAAATEAGAGILDPDPEVIELSHREAPLGWRSMMEIALAFSGVDESRRGPYLDAVAAIRTRLEESLPEDIDSYRLGEYLLEYLHEHVLVRYRERQTRLDVLLDSGVYNCVSSSVLYFALAESFGLPVRGTATPDHAFCSVDFEDRIVDVETTTKYGFDPGRRKEFRDTFGNLTGYSYVPPSSYRKRSEIDGRELLALILHNRISEADAGNDYRTALSISVDRHAFLRTEESYADLVREISNYVALLNRSRRYDEALSFLESVHTRYGSVPELAEVHRGMLHNRVVAHLNTGEFEAARSLLARHEASGYIDGEALRELDTFIAQRELAETLPELEIERAFAYLQEVNRRVDLPERTWRELSLSLYARWAEQTASEAGYLEAVEVIEEAMTVLGRDPRLDRARAVYRHNFAVETHNRFAEHFNAGRLEEAHAIIVTALELFPDSPLLSGDLATIERVLGAEKTD